jgi:hypothetical protein
MVYLLGFGDCGMRELHDLREIGAYLVQPEASKITG